MKPRVQEQNKVTKARPQCLVCLKAPSLYALLPSCCHAFCVSCLSTHWNTVPPKQRKCLACTCPQRNFVPSNVWYDNDSQEKKEKLKSYFFSDREDISDVLHHLTHYMGKT